MTRTRPFSASSMRRCAGVGLVTAIFLLVVISALGVAMVAIYTSQQSSSALDVQGARAYQAARAGIEAGLYRQLRLSQCPATTTFAMDATTSLRGFTVTVTCEKIAGPVDADGAAALDRYRIVSVACNEPASGICADGAAPNVPDYVRRVMEVQL